MNYSKPLRYLAAMIALLLLCSCIPASEDSENLPVPSLEPPFDVDISVSVLPQDVTSRVVLIGEVGAAPPCTFCEPGYFTLLPFGESSEAVVGLQYGEQRIEAFPHPLLSPDRENYYRFSYVDEDGYTNSAVARYRPQSPEQVVTVYSHPASENDSHLVFTVVFHQDLFEPNDITIRYPGNGRSPNGINLGKTNFISSYLASSPDSQGRREFDFKIELEESDDEPEGIEYAPVTVIFKGESSTETFEFKGVILDDDSENLAVNSAAPPPMPLQASNNVCSLSQSDRLGSSGDVRFSLEWDNPHSDLNVWVKDPCSNVSSHLSTGSQCGQYEVSRESTEGLARPSENIVWAAGAEAGEYAFAVEHFRGVSTEYTLCVYHDDIVKGYRGTAEGGAVSEIVTLQVNNGNVGDFSPVASSETETPDFDYSGETAELFSVKDFSVDPVTVVQSVEDGSLRAELQFQFDVLNVANECQGRQLEVSIVDEQGGRTSAQVIGNNTYKETMAEQRGELAYLPMSDWIALSEGGLASFSRSIDIPLSEEIQVLELEFVFSSAEPSEYDWICPHSSLGAPAIPPLRTTIYVPGINDVNPLTAGGPNVTFAYPYLNRREGIVDDEYDDDIIYLQYKALLATEEPNEVELHVNRELYRSGLPFSDHYSHRVEVDGEFIMRGVNFDYRHYLAPVELRYVYLRNLHVYSDGQERVEHYRLALSAGADIAAVATGEHTFRIKRDTLFYYDVWEPVSVNLNYDGREGVNRPTTMHLPDYVYLHSISGSLANDIYHIGRDAGAHTGESPVRIIYSIDGHKGHDVLSFSEEMNVNELIYYRLEDDLVILREDFFDEGIGKRYLDEANGDIARAVTNLVDDEGDAGYFALSVEHYFNNETKGRPIDEFRWNNVPYITHEEILEVLINL